MTITLILASILASIGAVVIILTEAERILGALAAFIRSCIPLIQALGELRAALAHAFRRPGAPRIPAGGEESMASPSPAERVDDSTTDA